MKCCADRSGISGAYFSSDRRRRFVLWIAGGEKVMAWKITASGQPSHPLYLPADIKPVPYRGAA